MSEDELVDLCAEWQERLRLQDWRVGVRIARARDFDMPECQGECSWVRPRKEARISILDPEDYVADNLSPQDMESTLVHELLHLHFAPFNAEHETEEQIAQEQAIELIAEALVALKRVKTPGPTAGRYK